MDLDIELKILDKRLGTDFPLPDYATSGAAGMDLRAMVEKDTVLNSGETRLIPAGFSMHIADKNVCATIFPRSGLGAKHGLVLDFRAAVAHAEERCLQHVHVAFLD